MGLESIVGLFAAQERTCLAMQQRTAEPTTGGRALITSAKPSDQLEPKPIPSTGLLGSTTK